MSLSSMTGYGFAESTFEGARVSCQIRTVNHRFFDWKSRIPHVYFSFESAIKERVRECISRGAVEISLRRERVRQTADRSGDLPFDPLRVKVFAEGFRDLADDLGIPKTITKERVLDWVLGFPQALEEDVSLEDVATRERDAVLDLVGRAARQVQERRREEGKGLFTHCVTLLKELEQSRLAVEGSISELPEKWRDKVIQRLSQWTSDPALQAVLSSGRLEQELIVFADRADVSEEIQRLQGHIQTFLKLISEASEPVGKKLDFYVQELHREVNTLSSKVADTGIALTAVGMKSKIEQLREQVQNIE